MNQKTKKLLGSVLAVLVLLAYSLFGGGSGSEGGSSSPDAAASYSQSVQSEQQAQQPQQEQPTSAAASTADRYDSPADSDPAQSTAAEHPANSPPALDEHGSYDSKDEVALYIHLYGKLPENYITKKEAEALGWSGGSVERYAPGKCIGGSRFGNYEGLLPDAPGRTWTECDIDTLGASSRGAKRIVFSNDGLIYYTGDHYESFELLYGEG